MHSCNCEDIGNNYSEFRVDPQDIEKKLFVEQMKILSPQFKEKKLFTREEFRKKFKIPAAYFIKRNFQAKTLDDFDVGFCDEPRDVSLYYHI